MDIIGLSGLAVIFGSFVYVFLRKALLSLSLSISFLIIFGLLAITSRFWGNPIGSPGFIDLVLIHVGATRTEEILTFFTTMFVHHNLLHLGFNMVALILIGTPLEERIGPIPFTIAFMIGGILGSLTFYILHFNEVFILLGASGAIAAELGVFARLYPRERVVLFLPFFPLPAIPMIWVAIGFLLISSLLVPIIPGIAHEAHIGGLITGFLIAPLIRKIPTRHTKVRRTIDYKALGQLANTSELTDILDRIKNENVSEVREAWLDQFVQRASCPRCGKSLRISMGRIVSECGWRLNFR